MTEYYKLQFDLSLYFLISGYFLFLTTASPPSAAAFLLLSAAAALDAVFRAVRGRALRRLQVLLLLLPLLSLLLHPSLWQVVQWLPAWLYLGWSILTDRITLDYDTFRAHFSLALKLLLLLVFGPLFPAQLGAALLRAVPYLVLMLTIGVCLLRMLREQRPSGLRQGLYVGLFVLICAALTLGQAPQFLLKCVGLLYRSVLAPLIFVLALALAVLFYGFYLLMKWIVARAQGSQEPLHIDLQNTAQMLGLEDQYQAYAVNLEWLRILLIVFAVCVLLFLLWRLFRRLLGEREQTEHSSLWSGRRSPLRPDKPNSVRPGLVRPRDARLAVRYYYARFLAECRRRGITIPRGMTASEIPAYCAAAFPGVDLSALTQLYLPVRYCSSQRVTRANVQRAGALWRAIRESEAPGAAASQKKRKSP